MKKKVVVRDVFQNYTYYLTEPVGKNFHKNFRPQLTPKEMLELGVFGGLYMTDGAKEFPKEWFSNAKLAENKRRDKNLNFFGINASQPLKVWKENGWIHEDDPRGWFQWYCRYYMGRRHEDDERQIKRWFAYRRHAAQVMQNCRAKDLTCRKKQRQSLLHWAYDSRKF